MPDPFQQPYLDSSVHIAAIKGEAGQVDTARAIFSHARKGTFQVIASTLVIAEVIGAPRKTPLTEEQERVIDNYVFHDFITWVELDQTIALDARRLARQHGLKPADAVHVASAIRAGADQLLRWDDKFTVPNGTYENVVVCEPHLAGLDVEIEGFHKA
ncbi:MAG: type II toxin-antitoxin system VapC family toxin [Thermoleophilaceae bacterium]